MVLLSLNKFKDGVLRNLCPIELAIELNGKYRLPSTRGCSFYGSQIFRSYMESQSDIVGSFFLSFRSIQINPTCYSSIIAKSLKGMQPIARFLSLLLPSGPFGPQFQLNTNIAHKLFFILGCFSTQIDTDNRRRLSYCPQCRHDRLQPAYNL